MQTVHFVVHKEHFHYLLQILSNLYQLTISNDDSWTLRYYSGAAILLCFSNYCDARSLFLIYACVLEKTIFFSRLHICCSYITWIPCMYI